MEIDFVSRIELFRARVFYIYGQKSRKKVFFPLGKVTAILEALFGTFRRIGSLRFHEQVRDGFDIFEIFNLFQTPEFLMIGNKRESFLAVKRFHCEVEFFLIRSTSIVAIIW